MAELNKSLTAMDWLPKLNAQNPGDVTPTGHEDPPPRDEEVYRNNIKSNFTKPPYR